jgi:biopolymer transport protein ExbD
VLGGRHSAFGGGGHENANLTLNLTALMDILSNLLFFLLASYTAQAVEVQQKNDLQLPASSSQAKLSESLTVTVSRHQILVAGVPVAPIDHGVVQAEVDEQGKIVPLYKRLASASASRAAAGQKEGPANDTVIVLADRTTDAAILTSVLRTAGQAGFVNAKFGVLQQ